MIDDLLRPVAEDDEAGANLEYEPDFQALEELARPRPERSLGAGVIASEPMEWQRIAVQAEILLRSSKDLRLAVHLCVARLHLDGLTGFAEGLALVRGLLERFWVQVHPRLDTDEDDDPTERVNALAPLGEHERVLNAIRKVQLFKDVHPEHFSLRDLRIAQGVLKVDAKESEGAPGLAAIEACLRESPLDELVRIDRALTAASEDATAIVAIIFERTSSAGPNLGPLLTELRELQAFLQPAIAERSQPLDAGVDAPPALQTTASAGNASASLTIERAEDVRRVLDLVCAYYARAEPSSPVPLLLRRAQRLVGKDFAEVLRDLAPSGLSELEVVAGREDEA